MAEQLLRFAEQVLRFLVAGEPELVARGGERRDGPRARGWRRRRSRGRRRGRSVDIRPLPNGIHIGRGYRHLPRRSAPRLFESARCRQLPHRRGDVLSRKPAREELAHLPGRHVNRPAEEGEVVFILEVGRQESDRGQVEQPLGEHRDDDREPPRRLRGPHAVVRAGLRAVQHPAAIPDERLEAAREVQVPVFELDEVGDQLGRGLPRRGRQGRDAFHQGLVGE